MSSGKVERRNEHNESKYFQKYVAENNNNQKEKESKTRFEKLEEPEE